MAAAPALAIASLALSAAQTVVSAKQASAGRKAQAARMEQQQKHAALQQRIDERNLERQRKRDIGAARARLSASGSGTSGGSGAAALRGLNVAYDQRLSDGRALYMSGRAASDSLLDDRYGGLQSMLSTGQQAVGIGQQIVSMNAD
ncbi:MAG: hypothetical protein R8L07_09310 [Alphaproteobacteria bacterium]|nr:hypothetical protein [Alphaproteobacteria bacterium]